MSYIVFDGIEKNYGKQQIFNGFHLAVEKGSFVTLLGPSGCGKSTLLRCLAGLEPIAGGRIFLDGEDITKKPPKDRNVGMIFQQYSLFPAMTVYKNIAFGLKMQKTPKDTAAALIQDALAMVNLTGSENKYPSQLSGGEQQRVALARCIVTRPKVLLMDEPFSAIDAKLRKELQQRIREIHNELAITSIFVTHDQDEAMTLSDTIHLMNNCKIEQSGTPMELYANPKTSFVAGFMGNNNVLSPEDYTRLTGEESPAATVLIRPELIGIALHPNSCEGTSCMEGIISERIPQGNIVRYRTEAQGVSLSVDTIFEGENLYNVNDKVFLSIKEDDYFFL